MKMRTAEQILMQHKRVMLFAQEWELLKIALWQKQEAYMNFYNDDDADKFNEIQSIIYLIDPYFESMNCIPIEKANILAKEFQMIANILESR